MNLTDTATLPSEPAGRQHSYAQVRAWRLPLWPFALTVIVGFVVWDFWPFMMATAREKEVRSICCAGKTWKDAERQLIDRGYALDASSPSERAVLFSRRTPYLFGTSLQAAQQLSPAVATKLMGWSPNGGFMVMIDKTGTILP